MEGFIIKNVSNDYVVKNNKGIYNCKARGKFRNMKLTPLVGDYVVFDENSLYILDIKDDYMVFGNNRTTCIFS